MSSNLTNLDIGSQLRLDRLPLRIATLFVGLTGFGIGAAMIIKAGLGSAPWDALSTAVSARTGWSIGSVTIATSVIVLAAWVPLRQHPGLGTIANAVWVGVSIDLSLAVIPDLGKGLPSAVLLVGGIVVNGVADAIYIGAQLGPGPRDGLMTGIHHRVGAPIAGTRLSIEGSVLLVTWLLHGPIGIGTVLYALVLGPIVHVVLPAVTIPVQHPRP